MRIVLPEIILSVRDYECDLQGVVNNAVYLNYYEHARSYALAAIDLSVAALSAQGLLLMVSEMNVKFLAPLRGGDRAEIGGTIAQKGHLRLVFEQYIRCNAKICNQVVVTVVAVRAGRPQSVEWIWNELEKYLATGAVESAANLEY